jgi:hypothetical protein
MVPTLFYHEVESFRTELKLIKGRYGEIAKPGAVKNLTHASFGVSNRENQMVVGLCSLVEVCLLDRTKGAESPIRLSDVRGQGITRLKLFLSRLGIIDFGNLKNWAQFKGVYQLRNAIVHSYGGMIVDEPNDKLVENLSKLGLASVLVGGRRIRLDPNALETILNIVDSLLKELGAYENQRK